MTSKPRNFICNVKLVVHCMWHQLNPDIRHLVRPWGPSTCALRVCDCQLAVQLLAQLTYGASWPSIVQTMHQKVKGALALTLNKCVRSPGVPLTIGQQIRQIICSFPNQGKLQPPSRASLPNGTSISYSNIFLQPWIPSLYTKDLSLRLLKKWLTPFLKSYTYSE